MLKKIQTLLQANPGFKARAIAIQLGTERQHVNVVLYGNPSVFTQGDEHQWYLTSTKVLEIRFPGNGWLTSASFERALSKSGSPLESSLPAVSFIFGDACNIMMEALARLLAFSNQLQALKKSVTLDFSSCKGTLTYLDRAGFFEHLHSSILVLPKRPVGSKANDFNGNNHGLVELKAINPVAPVQNIPQLLKNSFVKCAGDSYSAAAFTVLSELLQNVEEHSGSTTFGFAGLQFYKKTNHIQAVISDSGLGIVGTLRPVLAQRHPEIAKKVAASSLPPDVALLQAVFSEGRISQKEADGCGLGLKRSSDVAKKYKAKITVRQEDFEFVVRHSPTGTTYDHSPNLVKLTGTHICFDFQLDSARVL
jgi:hypothetical protein